MSESQNLDWAQKLPESLRGSKLVLDAKTEDNFWKRIQDQQQYLGNSLQIPSTEASPEQWAEFAGKVNQRVPNLVMIPNDDSDDAYLSVFNKLGRPEVADKYDVRGIENLAIPDNELSALKQTAYESGLTQRQFAKLANKLNKSHADSMATAGINSAQERAALKSEWGEAVEDRLGVVANFMQDSGAPAHALEALKAGKLPAQQVKWLYAMASRMGEGAPLADGANPSGGNGGSGALTPTEATLRLDEIYNNKNHPYHHPATPAYQDAVNQVLKLVRMSNPE